GNFPVRHPAMVERRPGIALAQAIQFGAHEGCRTRVDLGPPEHVAEVPELQRDEGGRDAREGPGQAAPNDTAEAPGLLAPACRHRRAGTLALGRAPGHRDLLLVARADASPHLGEYLRRGRAHAAP